MPDTHSKLEHRSASAPSFLLKWLKSPFSIGAIAPSGHALARAMVAPADFSRPGAIIELGGGTGAITRAILGAGVPYDRLYSVEFDPELAKVLRHRFPALQVVEGNAAHLVELMARQGVTQAAAVISGLPLLGMPNELQQAILDGAFRLLGAGGRFIQFTYGPASPVRPPVRRALGIRGFRAGRALINLPPARVWCYEREPDRAHQL